MRRSRGRFDNWGCLLFVIFFLVPLVLGIVFYLTRPRSSNVPSRSSSVSSSWSDTRRPHNDDGKIYVTDTGECYHRSWCSSLDQSKTEISLEDAQDLGYRPCGRCHPPSGSTTAAATSSDSSQLSRTITAPASSEVVYVTDNGRKYHSAGCSYLSKSCNEIDLDKAKARGYTPCSRCNPPK